MKDLHPNLVRLAESVQEWPSDDYSHVQICDDEHDWLPSLAVGTYFGVGVTCFTRADWQAARQQLGLVDTYQSKQSLQDTVKELRRLNDASPAEWDGLRGTVSKPLGKQVGGNHYKDLAIQPVQYIHANKLGFCEGNVVKYISRWREKGGLSDLRKVQHFVDLLIELEGLDSQPEP